MPLPQRFWRGAGAGLLAVVSALTLAWSLGVPEALTARAKPRPFVRTKPKFRSNLDVNYVPTPQAVVDQMLELAEVKPGDVVYDLGCGDGRIVVTAAKRYGVKAFGFDLDPDRVAEARENARKNGVSDLVTIRQENIFNVDLGGASVVTMYLLPHLNVQLMPALAKLPPGSRIVSHAFPMKGARPKKVEPVREFSIGIAKDVYLWVVPWEKEKTDGEGSRAGSP